MFKLDKASERSLMVCQQIEPWGVNDPRVLDAFNQVPRECYLPERVRYQAYHDKSIHVMDIELLAPKVLAKMLHALDIQPLDKLLIVGIGCGYTYALARELTEAVIGLEINSEVHEAAKFNLSKQQIPLDGVYHQDGHLGFPDLGPFDKVLFTAAFDIYPSEHLFEQLSPGGKCFFFSQADGIQHGYIVHKVGQEYHQKTCFDSFVPYLKNIVRNNTFVL